MHNTNCTTRSNFSRKYIYQKNNQRVLRLYKPISYKRETITSNEITLIDGEYVITNEHNPARRSDKCHKNIAENSGGKKHYV